MNNIDKVFIINLDTDTDRWNHCVNELKKHNITDYERFPAIKPEFSKINKKLYKDFHYCKEIRKAIIRKKKKLPQEKKKYICGAIGCKLSHIEILKISLERKYKQILILEDDFIFVDNFKNKLDYIIDNIKHIDWKYLQLFRHNLHRTKNINMSVSRDLSCYSTLAQIIKYDIYQDYIDILENTYREIDVANRELKKKYICLTVNKNLINLNKSFKSNIR